MHFNLLGFITIIIMNSFYDYDPVAANQTTKGLKLKIKAVCAELLNGTEWDSQRRAT